MGRSGRAYGIRFEFSFVISAVGLCTSFVLVVLYMYCIVLYVVLCWCFDTQRPKRQQHDLDSARFWPFTMHMVVSMPFVGDSLQHVALIGDVHLIYTADVTLCGCVYCTWHGMR